LIAIGTIAAGLLLAAGTAAAQDVRVQVQIPGQIIHRIVREIELATRDVNREVVDALRDVSAELRREFAGARLAGLRIDAARDAGFQNRNYRFDQTDRQTRTLALGPTGWLELKNLVGDITVTAGSGRDVSVEIVRLSRGMTAADAKEGLDRVQARVEHKGDRASVIAEYPNLQRARFGVSVSYNVTAPAGTRVTIASTSGDIVVREIKGDVSAQVTSGDITVSGAGSIPSLRAISGDVTVTDASSDGAVAIGTMSGDVLLQRVKARRITADATSGSVRVRDSAVESVQLKSLSDDVEYTGALVRGGRYELQTHAGSVLFNFTGATGFELQANTFNGDISMPPSGIDFRNVSTGRRSLRGTVGDGGAVVSLTAFSGDIRITGK
jgi:hypothetical protein